MEVSVETTGSLERRMTVQVPAERVDQEVDNRLRGMARTARIDGFRPGKVPVKVVARKYGDQVRKEVVDQVIRATLDEAMQQHQIEPAGEPRIQWPENTQAGRVLEYVVTFHVYPELPAIQFGNAVIEKPVVEIGDQDLALVLEKLRKQRVAWEPVERESRMGDRLNIDFDGTIDGETFPGGHGANVQIELGSKAIVDGFDEQLTGLTAGSERTVTVNYPKDYQVSELAGKQAVFDVQVISVAEPKLPELDDDLARSFGIAEGGMEVFKNEVRLNMRRELEQALRSIMKAKVFDVVWEHNQVEVPPSLVEEEERRILVMEEQTKDGDGIETSPAEKAHRRVALGMLVGKIVKDNDIQVDPVRVRNMVETVAATYENPNEVVAWYYDNPDRLGEVQGAVLEDQVVDWVLEQIQVKEKPITFDDLMQLRQKISI